MRLYIGLFSTSPDLIHEFSERKEALIPSSARRKFGQLAAIKFDSFKPGNSKANLHVDDHLLKSSAGYDYVICLVDDGLVATCQNFCHAALFCPIQSSPQGNVRNYLSGRLTRALKVAAFTIERMSAADVAQAMSLPRRNFIAEDLRELCRLYREEVMEGDFHNLAKTQISSVVKRRQPRRQSNYRTKYFIDDERKYFVFGKEHHEVLPTGAPHFPHCELNGNFRFGRKIATDQHFNVSQGDGDNTSIEGQFPNCHDATVTPEKNRSHLNMFSNDHC